jgi:aspartate kinase
MMTEEKIQASGLIRNDHVAEIGLMDIPSSKHVGSKLFSALTDAGINLKLVVHLIDREEKVHIVLCVDRDDLSRAMAVVERIRGEVGGKAITTDPEMALVSLFNLDFREQHGVVGQIFEALDSRNVNVRGISTSLSTISCLIKARDLDEAVQALREAFLLY